MFILRPNPEKISVFRFRFLIAPLGLLPILYVTYRLLLGLAHGYKAVTYSETAVFVGLGLVFAFFGGYRTVVTFDKRLKEIVFIQGYPFLSPKIRTFPYRETPSFSISRETTRSSKMQRVSTYTVYLRIKDEDRIQFGSIAAYEFTIKPTITRANAWLSAKT